MLLTGAILVFLPGYDEIIMLRDRIQDEKRFSDSSRSVILSETDAHTDQGHYHNVCCLLYIYSHIC